MNRTAAWSCNGHTVLACLLVGASTLAFKANVTACGFDWSIPKSHFENADYRGYVFLASEIGRIQLSESTSIPLLLTFGSKRDHISPYAGYGWLIPLLDARFVQADENSFELHQPDGRFRQFSRDSKDHNVLHGQGDLIAEIQGEYIKVTAKCGEQSLLFKNGAIVQMEYRGTKLDYDYENGVIRSIRRGPTEILRIDRNTQDESISLIIENDKKVLLSKTERPVMRKEELRHRLRQMELQ